SADVVRFAAGSYGLELTDRTVLGRASGREVYRLVADVLELLDAGTPIEPVLRAFELHLLAASGYAPALHRCRACGTPAEGAERIYLSVERGGVLCRGCVPAGEAVRPIAGATAAELARIAAGPVASAATAVAARPLVAAAAVAEHLLAAVPSGPLRSRGFVARGRGASAGALR